MSNNIDLMAMTETWLGSDTDKTILSELTLDDHSVIHKPRLTHRGGGLVIVHSNQISMKPICQEVSFSHFEHIECSISVQNELIRLCIIYRPPPSKANHF
jgi:hypothetical protein